MQGPETRLRKKIVAALQQKYPTAWIRKIHGNAFQNRGIPDLLCCIESFFIGLEIKLPGHGKRNRATPVQDIEIQSIRAAGGAAGVITSKEQALERVDRALKHLKEKA